MRIAVIHPRLSYYSGGGEKYPMDSMLQVTRLTPDVNFDIYTTKTEFPSEKYTNFKNSIDPDRISLREKDVPYKYEFLYGIEPGESRFRWDAESLYFNSLVYGDLYNRKPDLLWSYYVCDSLSKPVDIPSAIHLLGYPRSKSDYREAFLAQYDAIIPNSRNALEKWNDVLERKITNSTLLHQGVNIKTVKEVPLSKNSFNIVFVGRLLERKGVCTLLTALLEVKKILKKEIALHIVGEGPHYRIIEDFVAVNGMNKYVHMEGYKENPFGYMKAANMCVFPSHGGDGLMSSVLEAMHYNGLVLATTENGNEEAISNGVNGFLVKPKDAHALSEAILRIIQNEPELLSVRKAARETIKERFTWQVHSDNFVSICNRLVQTR